MPNSDLSPGQRLQRLAANELAEIARELKRARKGKDSGVHKARKAMQRLRSLLRLARAAEPEWVAHTDRQLRSARRRLGRLRDAAVRVELVEAMLKRVQDPASCDLLTHSLEQLKARRADVWASIDESLWQHLDRWWARQAVRFERWPLLELSPKQIDKALERARRRVRGELRDALGSTQRNQRHDLRRHLRRYAAMRRAAATVLRRRDVAAGRLIDVARSLGSEGDLWLTCAALRNGESRQALQAVRAELERQRRALCKEHDGELVALRRGALSKATRVKKKAGSGQAVPATSPAGKSESAKGKPTGPT